MIEIPGDRVSLVVGVTGHRDIAAGDEAALRAAFGHALQRLSANRAHTPLLVLSGLAAGTDSLAAEEALARNIPVVACLPMPVAEYENDFSPDELVRFRSLLSKCTRVAIVSPKRENGYVALGRFIAQYSHLLVAFWDEDPSGGAGGTSEVVHMRLTSQPRSGPVLDVPYLPDAGPVEIIITPRSGARRSADAYRAKRLYPKDFAREGQGFDAVLSRIDCYNADLSQRRGAVKRSTIRAMMKRTDDVANRLQRKTCYFQLLLFTVAFVAAGVQIFGFVPAIAKVLGVAIALITYWVARKHNYENRYQDYRAIAEGLRVQDAWDSAGLAHRLVDREYLRMQEGELQWIRMALRFFYLVYCEGREHSHESQGRVESARWIHSQRRYYYVARRRTARLRTWLERIPIYAIAIGAVLIILMIVARPQLSLCALFWPFCSGKEGPVEIQQLGELLAAPLVLGAALGAIVAHYSERANVAANARRYDRMFCVFDRAARDLPNVDKRRGRDFGEFIYELGRMALIEHAEWLIMRRDTPMRVVLI